MDSRLENLVNTINKLRDNPVPDNLKEVKNALNRFFAQDALCKNFIYTNNTDKLPFGCIVFPILDSESVDNFMIAGDSMRVREYEVEIDSKMFDYGLTDEDVAAVILFNTYHMIKDTKPCNNVRDAIDTYFADEGKSLVIKNSVQYRNILKFGILDSMSQITSCLYLPEDVETDAFLESIGIYNLKEILDKLYKQIPGCENEASRNPKLSMLNWALRLYDNIDKERAPALKLLDKAKSITASSLYITKFNSIINALNRIDPDIASLNEAVYHTLNEGHRKNGLIARLKYDGLRDIESDLYEFQIRARNAETEMEVMYALKQINARLALLDNYIRDYQDTDPEINRWISVKMEYMELRDVLAKKKLHKRSYGIFVDYDKIDQEYDD